MSFVMSSLGGGVRNSVCIWSEPAEVWTRARGWTTWLKLVCSWTQSPPWFLVPQGNLSSHWQVLMIKSANYNIRLQTFPKKNVDPFWTGHIFLTNGKLQWLDMKFQKKFQWASRDLFNCLGPRCEPQKSFLDRSAKAKPPGQPLLSNFGTEVCGL